MTTDEPLTIILTKRDKMPSHRYKLQTNAFLLKIFAAKNNAKKFTHP